MQGLDFLLQGAICGKFNASDGEKVYELMRKKEALSDYTFPSKPSSDGYYHINVRDDTTKTGRRQIVAKELGELIEKLYEFEMSPQGKVSKTFKDVFELVQDESLRYVKDPEKKLSVMNTVNKRRNDYRRYFAGSKFESKNMADMTKKDIETICLANLEKYAMRKRAFQGMQAVLRAVFTKAYHEYWIRDNTYDRVDWKQPKFVNMLCKDSDVSERGYSDEEMDKICEFIRQKQEDKPCYLASYALEMQIIMGLRRGEIPPLRFSDIDYEKGYITISREQLTIKKSKENPREYFKIVEHTKTWKDRRYPLTDDLLDFLDRLQKVHDKYYSDSEYLFPSKTETGVITNNVVYNFYRRMCASLGIEVSKELTRGPHAFRRNAVTKVVEKSGGNIIMASQLFGNTPEVAKKNYYTGLNMDAAKKILNG